MPSIAEKLKTTRERVAAAAKRAGRTPDPIKLVAVSKTKPVSDIIAAYEAGQRVFGENYAQELKDKAKELSDLDIEWHFVGHLQKNKAKYVAPVVKMMETIDSIELALEMNKRAAGPIDCLIEVNIGAEETKSGCEPLNVFPLAKEILALKNLKLKGLMIIPPFNDDPEKSRPYFKGLKKLLDELNIALKLETPLTELSMGMTHDLEVAIEEGATIVRVGAAIFGERSYA